jgi:hypothetical protein
MEILHWGDEMEARRSKPTVAAIAA